MLIKRVVLENIRSYVHADISFPEGKILLGGDIGSGKSSILLAIDFALFGLTKDLTGGALLRNGATLGSVELYFEIDGKEVIIKRVLKGGSKINQSAGYIVLDGLKTELTPTELRQKVITLFGYPQELLTKKSLIYRYTVYTPQEEMKNILLGDKEARVDVLRKIFGVDKYKIIKQNADVFSKGMKNKMKEMAAYVAALDQKKENFDIICSKKEELSLLVEDKKKKREQLHLGVLAAEKDLSVVEEERKKNLELHHQVQLLQTKYDQQVSQEKLLIDRKEVLKQDISELGNKVSSVVSEVNQSTLDEIKKNLFQLGGQRDTILKDIQQCEVGTQNSQQLVKDIETLDFCPVCKQNVTAQHIGEVKNVEMKKIGEFSELLSKSQKAKETVEKTIEELKQGVENVTKSLQERELVAFQKKTLDQKKEDLHKVDNSLMSLQVDLKLIQKRIGDVDVSSMEELERKYRIVAKEKDFAVAAERDVAVTLAGHEQELKNVIERHQELNLEIVELEKKKDVLVTLRDLRTWVEQFFVPIVGVIEKKILVRLHADFDTLFQKWFCTLVDTNILSVTLDETFSPVILQNGHDMEYVHLSGGEKTAVALAYRLALNQVINNLLSVIKTKDLLILDEPTDGFSSDQLDRLRGLLDELQAKQIILVSHEPKIESFVDTVVRLEKSEHITKVLG